jgi:hypothetical protein
MSKLKGIGVLLLLAAGLVVPSGALADAPSNDAFAAADELTGRLAVVSSVNKDATKETGEPNHAGKVGGASVWYRWTSPAGGRATLNTCGSGFDTLLAVYTGASVDALTSVVGNDDACGLQSSVAFDASEGETYRIAVDGLQGVTGAFTLSLRLTPANDDFAKAVELPGDEGTMSGTTEGASSENGEPYSLGNSVWYSWTAPTTGPATVETCGSSLDTIVSVFTGSSVDSLSFVRWSDDGCGLASRASFDATVGVRYSIAVESYGAGGEFVLSWNRKPGPPEPITYPTITGTAREGQTLTATSGVWTGAPSSFAYQWGRCENSCDPIPGAASQTYALTSADVGHYVYLVVTATNAGGSGQAYAETNSSVRPAGPSNTAAPQVSGDARVGEVLLATPGIWTGIQPIQLSYKWQACDGSGNSCVDLQGETAGVLEVSPAHVGSRLRVIVSATNVDGTRSATSEPTAVVAKAVQTTIRRCVVPQVRGKSVRAARAAIKRGGCRVGRVRMTFSARVKAGRVVSQTPRAGRRLAAGARVKLLVSKGKRH